jgi:hypothetical protein
MANKTPLTLARFSLAVIIIALITVIYLSVESRKTQPINIQNLPTFGDKKATINGSLNIATAGGTALTIDNGFIKVAGTNRTAFQVVSSADNTSGNATSLSYPNASTTDIVTVTPVWTGTYLNSPIGIYFTSGEWRVFRQDLVTMPNGITFNVIVIKQ